MCWHLRVWITCVCFLTVVICSIAWCRSYWFADCVWLDTRSNLHHSIVSEHGTLAFRCRQEKNLRVNGLVDLGFATGDPSPSAVAVFDPDRLHVFKFSCFTLPEFKELIVPHWFMILLTAAIGIACKFKSWYQIGLYEVIVLMTLCCLALGLPTVVHMF
jgi:hypothetical protein